MAFLLQHTRLGFCWLDLIALAVLLVVIGVFVWQHRKLKKQESLFRMCRRDMHNTERKETLRK